MVYVTFNTAVATRVVASTCDSVPIPNIRAATRGFFEDEFKGFVAKIGSASHRFGGDNGFLHLADSAE